MVNVQMELQKETLNVLRDLYKMTRANAEAMETVSNCLMSLVTVTADGKVHMGLEEKPLYVSIPDSGDTYEVLAGDTYIDFHRGVISKPDGTQEALRFSLKKEGRKYMRSCLIVADQEIVYSVDGGGYQTLRAGERISLTDDVITQLYLRAETAANVRIRASTSPRMTNFYDQAIDVAYRTLTDALYDADSSAACSVEVDTTEYGRPTVEILASASSALDFVLEASLDNEHWFTVETFTAQTSVHYAYTNAMRYLRFSTASTAAGTVSMLLMAGV